MDYYSKLAITFFFFIIFFVSVSSQCSRPQCSQYGPDIQSPFWFAGLQPASCNNGQLGFSLSCNKANQTILNLPQAGAFNVDGIYYNSKKILLTDPNKCLAQKLLNLNLSATPFHTGDDYEDYTFYNCSNMKVGSAYNAYVISCLSGYNYSVVATTSSVYLPPTCMVIKQVKLFTFGFYYYGAYTFEEGLFQLDWDITCPGCQGRCDYKNTSTLETTCIINTPSPIRGSGNASSQNTIIGVLVIAMIICCGIPCCLACAHRENRTDDEVVAGNTSSTVVVTSTSGVGMDTFKVIIGESCRLPNPEADTCPICMSKYEPKDSIKSVFECSHYFHVDCIDEWLQRNATCPLCRTSPLSLAL